MINFLKYRLVYFLISAIFILSGAYFLVRFGLKPAVDFTGGTLLEVELSASRSATLSQVKAVLEPQINLASLQQTGPNSFLLRSHPIDQSQSLKLQQLLSAELDAPVTEKRFATIGPTLGQELIKKTLVSLLLAAGFILAYVTFRFKDKKYGVCAILAMLHDTFIILGSFSFLGYAYGVEVDALFVTALLTILSFSVHDTIVVYDRIRENLKTQPKADFASVVNQAITQTLARSINNSLTIIFMLMSLFLLGGDTIKWFIATLLIGTISGTYSSTFTAAPLLVLWEQLKTKHHTPGV
ncbi:MAG: SecF protein [Candidatus Beckwithbacteria bacterium GW2011_GWB1_47_15]|uniref:Protein-export membrane protein SecF n=1 Tax=Candidatus Beckwithbacteria bacterium GW2011_GWB1_47_15 TaxID=1618371 RepID=A0A0G1UWC0_9BACT|nr:MAG: protein-export membrane protein SecF, preprotein translocase subunit SecF [Candidatus Beckwithbacteria bacterium GW2011_GWC1_49_16]AQS30856.1 hypothetical protein [uncultured bacterium]KKU36041.1 MAG: SecF protein [Candidatus Beckwithbacteria bacterium GW2011_GWA1_46_30]KKU62005.1 MAG: SecF protein [Candidatus Beckwithbacteria bacterium GW2011_GWB1_47_15]KKU72441.1 MAG: SecF protein [Candidatus Beckwithbacteria bacterium GW2011_GWA2_47_25]OGD49347.1 MAG: protein-export membrane protein